MSPVFARFQYLTQQLLPRLEPYNAVAKDWAADLTDLRCNDELRL